MQIGGQGFDCSSWTKECAQLNTEFLEAARNLMDFSLGNLAIMGYGKNLNAKHGLGTLQDGVPIFPKAHRKADSINFH